MLKSLFFSLLLSCSFLAYSQLNMSLVDHIEYDVDLNDIWGYTAPDGVEYAIVGANNGVSIVSLADPSNATEVAFVPGQNSIWRDIKTWGTFAYVVTDESGTTEGVTVIDLSNLPNSVEYFHWTPTIPNLGTIQICHNIYIDEFSYAYLAGCNVNGGGMLYIDVFTTPGQPVYVGKGPSNYAHDVFTRDNKMYSSELNIGRMAIYDVTDKNNTIELGIQTTPYEFTHNIWVSDDDNVAFTTDELGNAPVVAYDVSDPTDIQELDQYRPTATLGTSVIPHNVHVWDDWLIISYYTDGGRVVDASRPHNLVEVGNFDTFFGTGAGFNGVWGAYPFLPSGLVLLTDIGDGLYVLEANYVRACFVEGLVTNANTGIALDDVEVIIDIADEPNINYSELNGSYGTGIATAGTYEITFSKPGYIPFTTSVDLENGIVFELDVALEPLVSYHFNGVVIDAANTSVIPGATITLDNGESIFTIHTDENGQFSIPNVYASDFQLYAGAWGYQLLAFDYTANNNTALTLSLTPGYEDDFALDLGWESIDGPSTRTGSWELGKPIGTIFGNSTSNPAFDIEGDVGDKCYVTGNAGGTAPSDDVDGGRVTLRSPSMDFSAWANTAETAIYVSYNLWFYAAGGNGNPDDELTVTISNGMEEVVIETLSDYQSFWRPTSLINISDLIDMTDNMTIAFSTSDFDVSGHVVEAAVDAFSVQTVTLTDTKTPKSLLNWTLAPNPFKDHFQMDYQLENGFDDVEIVIFNSLGVKLASLLKNTNQSSEILGRNWT